MRQHTATRRTLKWTAAIAVGLLGICIVSLPWWADAAMRAARQGPEHRFELNPPPPFLTETMALEKARESLQLDGFDPTEWDAVKDDRTKAPDGRPDEYFLRNTLNPNEGSIQFVRRDRRAVRSVVLELHDSTLVTHIWIPK